MFNHLTSSLLAKVFNLNMRSNNAQIDPFISKWVEVTTSIVVEPWPHFHLTSAIFTVVTEKENAAAAGSPALNADGNGKPVKEGGRGGRKKSRLAAAASTGTTATANPPSMDLDLPVDPNEPTYCLCNQVSYGEMVACDNPDVSVTVEVTILGGSGGFGEESERCKIEWFHYGCVGLKEQPKGKWYCTDCSGMQKRRKGK